MRYGEQIGLKFEKDGTPRTYPGNTVIADVLPENPAYVVMQALRKALEQSRYAPSFIFLPEDSYHMTVIRGLNGQVRRPEFWPAALALDVPMEEADDYIAAAVASVPNPGPIAMRFDRVRIDQADVRVCLLPKDETQRGLLCRYRDQVADAVGLRLPGHDLYTYHITLAYTRQLIAEREQAGLDAVIGQMDAILSGQPPFLLDPPYMAFYNYMVYFSPIRLGRGR